MAHFFLACLSLAVNPERVHLIDTYPRNQPHIDLNLENPTDTGYFQEKAFWDANPRAGELVSYPTLGSLQDVKHPVGDADELVKSGDWAIQGHADYLPERLAAVHANFTNTSGPPTIFYVPADALPNT